MSHPVVFTNIPARISKTWADNVKLVDLYYDSTGLADPSFRGSGRTFAMRVAWRLFRWRSKADCFVTTGDLVGIALACLQSLFPLGRKPHLIMDALWEAPRHILELWIRRVVLSFAYRSVTKTFVLASREIDAYSNLFQLPKEKFTFVPFSHRLTGYDYSVSDQGYIWAGGNGDRDYRTFIEAVKDIDYPVVINATRSSLFNGFVIPPHVTIRGATPQEFRQCMAGCTLGVIPMEGGKLHSGGQQTFIGLMHMGKPTIVTDPGGAKDYITHGQTGFVVPPGDVMALREAIRFLLEHPDESHTIGRQAGDSVAQLTEEQYMKTILHYAWQAAEQKTSRPERTET